MYKPLLLILFAINTSAQQEYLEFNPVSWEELQELQMDSLYEIDKLSLETSCPSSLFELIKLYPKHTTKYKAILGTFYKWTEFINEEEKICLVKHLTKDSLMVMQTNLSSYEILSTIKTRALLSAADSKGFVAKGISNEEYWTKSGNIYKYNDNISTSLIKKYGGARAVHQFIQKSKNKEKYENIIEQLIQTDGISGPIIKISMNTQLLLYFEKNYSAQQRQLLIDKVNNRIYTKSDLILLENHWKLISYQIKNSERQDILENSSYLLSFDKITLAFKGSIDCNRFNGQFTLNNGNLNLSIGPMTTKGCLHFPIKFITHNSDKTGKEITKSIFNSKEPLYKKQTDTIEKIIRSTISFKIENSQLILSTEDSSKLIFE